MKDIKLIISSILIILSFFVWYMFCKRTYETKIKEITNEKKYINIEVKDNDLNIENDNKNIIILINWKENKQNSIKLN